MPAVFFIVHDPCEYGRGNHYRGPFLSEQGAADAVAEMAGPGDWHVTTGEEIARAAPPPAPCRHESRSHC